MDRKPGHLTKSVQEIAGSLFWIKVVLYFIGKGQHVSISKVVETSCCRNMHLLQFSAFVYFVLTESL